MNGVYNLFHPLYFPNNVMRLFTIQLSDEDLLIRPFYISAGHQIFPINTGLDCVTFYMHPVNEWVWSLDTLVWLQDTTIAALWIPWLWINLTFSTQDTGNKSKGRLTQVVFRRSLVRKLTIDGNELRRLALW